MLSSSRLMTLNRRLSATLALLFFVIVFLHADDEASRSRYPKCHVVRPAADPNVCGIDFRSCWQSQPVNIASPRNATVWVHLMRLNGANGAIDVNAEIHPGGIANVCVLPAKKCVQTIKQPNNQALLVLDDALEVSFANVSPASSSSSSSSSLVVLLAKHPMLLSCAAGLLCADNVLLQTVDAMERFVVNDRFGRSQCQVMDE